MQVYVIVVRVLQNSGHTFRPDKRSLYLLESIGSAAKGLEGNKFDGFAEARQVLGDSLCEQESNRGKLKWDDKI